MKTYVLMLSEFFPGTHHKAGQPTYFADKIEAAGVPLVDGYMRGVTPGPKYKYHTIRANYDLWKKRFDEIQAGKACLSIRQWFEKPYRSKQVELVRLTREDGIGIQKLTFKEEFFITDRLCRPYIDGLRQDVSLLANNDGLNLGDWLIWFEKYNLDKPMAVIQFTQYRYN